MYGWYRPCFQTNPDIIWVIRCAYTHIYIYIDMYLHYIDIFHTHTHIYLLALSLPGAVPQVLGEGLQGSDRVAVLQRCGHAAVPPTGWNGGHGSHGTCFRARLRCPKWDFCNKHVDLTCVKSWFNMISHDLTGATYYSISMVVQSTMKSGHKPTILRMQRGDIIWDMEQYWNYVWVCLNMGYLPAILSPLWNTTTGDRSVDVGRLSIDKAKGGMLFQWGFQQL